MKRFILIIFLLSISIISVNAQVYIDITDTTNPENDLLYVTDYAIFTFTHDMNFTGVWIYDDSITMNTTNFAANETCLVTIDYVANNLSQINTVGEVVFVFYANTSGPTTFTISGFANERYQVKRGGTEIASPTGGTLSFSNNIDGEHQYYIIYNKIDISVGQYMTDILSVVITLILLSMIIRLKEEWF